MPVSEKQKGYAAKWDKENMRCFACRVRTNEAEAFKAYCKSIGSTPTAEIKKFVHSCVENFNKDKKQD